MSIQRTASPESRPTVFISHSHFDRDFALYIDHVLKKNGATTFLDQEQLIPGEELPAELAQGIRECGVFMLFWSRHSAASGWVDREWNLAYERRKKIVPYCLDETQLPEALSNMIFISNDDRDHGHVGLLQAVFGKSFLPSTSSPFPGKWRMEAQQMGNAAWYEFELTPAGQLSGTGGCYLDRGQAAIAMNQLRLINPVAAATLAETLGHPFAINGSWSYDDREQTLTLDVEILLFGQKGNGRFQFATRSCETGELVGRDATGMSCRLWRSKD